MVKRNKYTTGVFHKLKVRQIANDEGFVIDELFLILLDGVLKKWFSFIIQQKISLKKKPVIRHYDLSIYSGELERLLNGWNKP